SQNRCPIVNGVPQIPAGRPQLQKPFLGNPTISGDSGEGYHIDGWFHEYYAVDFQDTFDVFAAASGTLIKTTETGATVAWIDHGNDWYTKYAHLASVEESLLNKYVPQGTKIGASGNTGSLSQGIHLHFELRHGDGQFHTNNNGWSYPVPEIYAPAGWIDVCNTTVQSTPIPVPPTAQPTTVPPTPIPSPTPIPDTNKPTGWLVSAPSLANDRFTVKVHAQDTGGSGLSWVKIMSVGAYSFGEVLMGPDNGLYVGTVETGAIPDRTKLYYVIRAQDGAGNNEQLTGTNETTIIHDNTPPTGSYVNPPGSADDYFKLHAQVQDTGGVGVAWVRMSVWPKEGGVSENVNLEYNQETSLWQVDFSVSSKPSGTEYQYLLWAGDGFNNETQITGMGSFVVTHDISPPTGGFVNPPATADTTLTIKAQVTDPSGVTWVTISIRPQGQGFTQWPLVFNASTNLWEFQMDTRAAPSVAVVI
ncbi:hypothetical protein COX84_05650, partial [Candidatus Micrarchaeota archaeon CG_4_10_14_0_2_um_filter_49_7]